MTTTARCRALCFVAVSSTRERSQLSRRRRINVGGDGDVTVGVVGQRRRGLGRRGRRGRFGAAVGAVPVSWSVDPTPAQTGSLNGLCRGARQHGAASPCSGSIYHLVGTRPDGRDRRRPVRVRRVPERRHHPTAARTRRSPRYRRSVKRGTACSCRRRRSRSIPRPAASPVSTRASRPPARRPCRSRRRSAATRSPAPRRSTTTRSASTGKPATNAGTGHYTFETKGNHTDRGQRGLARHGRDHRARPAGGAAGGRPRHRDDHLDPHLPRQRDPLGPPALSPDGEPAGTVSAHVVGRRPALPRQRELLGPRAVAALLHRRARPRRSARAPRPRSTQPGAAFGLDRARWDASILLGPQRLRRRRDRPPRSGTSRRRSARRRRSVDRDRIPTARRAGARPRRHDRPRSARSAGSVWSEPFAHALEAGGEIRLVLVGDPDGTAIELIEGGPPTVSFVAITCADLDRSRAFYAALGFREVARYPSENADGAHLRVDGPVAMDEIVLAAPGGGEVLFMLVGFRTPRVRPRRAARREHARHVARRVPRRRSRRRGRRAARACTSPRSRRR